MAGAMVKMVNNENGSITAEAVMRQHGIDIDAATTMSNCLNCNAKSKARMEEILKLLETEKAKPAKLQQTIAELEKEISDLNAQIKIKGAITSQLREILLEFKKQIEDSDKKIAELSKEIAEKKADFEGKENLEAKIRELEKKIKDQDKQKETYLRWLKGKEERIIELELKIQNLKDELENSFTFESTRKTSEILVVFREQKIAANIRMSAMASVDITEIPESLEEKKLEEPGILEKPVEEKLLEGSTVSAQDEIDTTDIISAFKKLLKEKLENSEGVSPEMIRKSDMIFEIIAGGEAIKLVDLQSAIGCGSREAQCIAQALIDMDIAREGLRQQGLRTIQLTERVKKLITGEQKIMPTLDTPKPGALAQNSIDVSAIETVPLQIDPRELESLMIALKLGLNNRRIIKAIFKIPGISYKTIEEETGIGINNVNTYSKKPIALGLIVKCPRQAFGKQKVTAFYPAKNVIEKMRELAKSIEALEENTYQAGPTRVVDEIRSISLERTITERIKEEIREPKVKSSASVLIFLIKNKGKTVTFKNLRWAFRCSEPTMKGWLNILKSTGMLSTENWEKIGGKGQLQMVPLVIYDAIPQEILAEIEKSNSEQVPTPTETEVIIPNVTRARRETRYRSAHPASTILYKGARLDKIDLSILRILAQDPTREITQQEIVDKVSENYPEIPRGNIQPMISTSTWKLVDLGIMTKRRVKKESHILPIPEEIQKLPPELLEEPKPGKTARTEEITPKAIESGQEVAADNNELPKDQTTEIKTSEKLQIEITAEPPNEHPPTPEIAPPIEEKSNDNNQTNTETTPAPQITAETIKTETPISGPNEVETEIHLEESPLEQQTDSLQKKVETDPIKPEPELVATEATTTSGPPKIIRPTNAENNITGINGNRQTAIAPARKPANTVLVNGDGPYHAVMKIVEEAKSRGLNGLGVEVICKLTSESDFTRDGTINAINQLLKRHILKKTFSADTLANSAVGLASNTERGIFKN